MKKHGFTIIEIALVIAVAGLIYLGVFIVIPSLSSNARDTERKEDISKFLSNVSEYQTNHRGALPDDYSSFIPDSDPSGNNYNLIIAACNSKVVDADCVDSSSSETFSNFYANAFPDDYNFLIVTGASCNGTKAVATSSQRKLAVLYHLESGGIYCNNL